MTRDVGGLLHVGTWRQTRNAQSEAAAPVPTAPHDFLNRHGGGAGVAAEHGRGGNNDGEDERVDFVEIDDGSDEHTGNDGSFHRCCRLRLF